MEYRQFVKTMHSLYKDMKVSKEKIVELFESGKISEKEKSYILE